MRRIAHLSDLHFGAEDPLVADALLDDLSKNPPQLIAVSGDLTQRAREEEFTAARAFLDRMAPPKLIVPGNHDVPLYNLLNRLLFPLTRYRRLITPDLSPWFLDEEIAVAGTNTARSGTWKEGRISLSQMARLRSQFNAAPPERFKVLVAHHPFIPSQHNQQAALVGRAKLALKTLEACGCSLILAGHLHQAYSGDVRPHHVEIKRSILVAQAGTAISHRRRDEPNAYNQIVFDGDKLSLEVRAWDGQQFAQVTTNCYRRHEEGWQRVA